MASFLQLALWNANGLAHHADELQTFLAVRNIDIMLLSETLFTQKSCLKLSHYTIYHTNHPAGTARGGTAIIIKTTTKHHPLRDHSRDYLQATGVSVEDTVGLLTISAVYLPPKHAISQEQLEAFYATLGPRFIAGGDYNAKHTDWGSRLITPRGRVLLKTMESNHLTHLSTGQPTYRPSDVNKLPDLVDFCVTKGVSSDFAVAQSCLDLSSDHSPVLVTFTSHAIPPDAPPSLSNRLTNWDYFRHLIHYHLTLQVSRKTGADIEAAVEFFNVTVQWAGWMATPELPFASRIQGCPITIQQKLAEKRQLLRAWHRFRTPMSKRLLNAANQDLKQLLRRYKNARPNIPARTSTHGIH
jgi:exonuclease III